MSELVKGNLIKVNTALNSMRDSGFDLSTAVGEPVDNSIQAGAKNIHIVTKGNEQKIDEIAFIDDGAGISKDILPNVLTLGFSTRYNDRQGLGRFGVGMKLAGISHGKRIDVYTINRIDEKIYHVFIDLDMIMNEDQKFIELKECEEFPDNYKLYMMDEKGRKLKSGTLIIWSKIDRLNNGGKYGNSIQYKMSELTKFLGRAYRYYLDNGLRIKLDDKEIFASDPLYLMENKLAIKILGKDVRAELIDRKIIEIDGNNVEFSVTLLPEDFRRVKGEGGNKGKASKYKSLNISENQGRISIVRNGREIYYDVIPRILPSGIEDVDRYIGIELKFPAELDEYFSVRHVKRGAEPIDKLRQELREFLKRPVKIARKKVRDTWSETAKNENKDKQPHEDATNALKNAAKLMPSGTAGMNKSSDEKEKIIEDALTDLGIDKKNEPKLADKKIEELKQQPITMIDSSWPGKTLLAIDHLNGRAILKINTRHIFMEKIYSMIKDIANSDPNSISASDIVADAQLLISALDILLMSYAKAENMHPNPEEAYTELKDYWGIFMASSVEELLKMKNIK